MSKFLKFIVHFVVICTIICVLALALPPFFGVKTQIMDDSSKESNLSMGSVTYAIPVKAEEISVGDSLLVQEDSSAYKYKITAIDLEKNTLTVVDPTVSGAETVSAMIKEYVPKIVLTVPFLGYLLVATESIEGLIVLGLAVLFLIILYVIAELTKKSPQDDYDYEDDDPEPGYVKSKKELKREEKAKARLYKEEERQIKKEDKQRKKNKKKIRTGGFVDEIYEDDLEPEEEAQQPVAVQAATSEAHELLRKEIAAATAEELPEQEPVKKEEPVTQDTIFVVDEVKKALDKKTEKAEKLPEPEEPAEIRKLAVPVFSAAQLAEAAKRQGDAPEIVRDEVTKVTLFDYSDIIAGNEPEEEK